MVSLWPFKSNDTDAATFEKTLSSLATKIAKASSRNDTLRQQARRLRVGWVLYGGFAYILVFLILTLVNGWQNWGPYEYTIVAGGPPLLYAVRLAIITFYAWRIQSSQQHLDSLYKQRDTTIDKLKKATKYDSTQQLLDKYGSPKPSAKEAESKQSPQTSRPPGPQEKRVFRRPPPTANIRRDQPAAPQPPSSLHQKLPDVSPSAGQAPSLHRQQGGLEQPITPPELQSTGEGFAPNAFGDAPLRYAPSMSQSRWYDRIMDALLGEDETQARNRIALICQSCRLVNGQAPPGTKSLEEIGRWRCTACGAWNGRESETKRAMQQLAEHGDIPVPTSPIDSTILTKDGTAQTREGELLNDRLDDAGGGSFDSDAAEDYADTPAKSTRSRKSGKK